MVLRDGWAERAEQLALSVGTAAIGCPVGRSPATRRRHRCGKQNPRRAALAWTAGGGCPYVSLEGTWRFSNDGFQARRQPSLFLPPVDNWEDWIELDPNAW